MKKAVFLDLDGTLWDKEVVPESAMEAIKEARDNGNLVFTNTGRSRSTAWPMLKDLPLDGQVYSLGSEIWENGVRILYEPLPYDLAKEMLRRLKAVDIGIAAEGSNGTFGNRKNVEYLTKHMGANKVSDTFRLLPDLEDMKDEDLYQVMKFSVHDLPEGYLDDFMEEHELEFTPFFFQVDGRPGYSGEITRRACTKGTAIQKVKELYSEPLFTIAIGDSDNDLNMLQAADLAIAMGNGTPTAKAAADWTTDTLHNDGLRKAFEYAGLIEKREEDKI